MIRVIGEPDPRSGTVLSCGHPPTAIVRDPAGVEVCSLCSPDVTTPSTVRPQRPRRCWEHPPGTIVTKKEPA